MSKDAIKSSREYIKSKVIDMIAENTEIDKDSISEKSTFNVDIILDSLSFAELLMGCEEVFDIEIPMEDASDFKTVNDLIDYLVKKVNA